jgi:D-alanyl-D-alanine carboxypeptidase
VQNLLKKVWPLLASEEPCLAWRTAQRRTVSVYGKSGTMTRIKSFAGYVDSSTGKKLAYAMIINNHYCTSAQLKKYFENLMIKMSVY